MKKFRIIQLIINTVLVVLMSVAVITTIPGILDELLSFRHFANFQALLFTIILLVLIVASLSLNFKILNKNGVFTFDTFTRLPKGNLINQVIFLFIGFSLVWLVANLPKFYTSSDCSGGMEMSVPTWMLVFDQQRSEWRHRLSYPIDIPQLLIFSLFLTGLVFYCLLKNSGLIKTKTTVIPNSVRSWWIYSQMLVGSLFILFAIFILNNLISGINGLISIVDFDENVVVSFAIYGFIVLFILSVLIIMYGLWVIRDGIKLKNFLSGAKTDIEGKTSLHQHT